MAPKRRDEGQSDAQPEVEVIPEQSHMEKLLGEVVKQNALMLQLLTRLSGGSEVGSGSGETSAPATVVVTPAATTPAEKHSLKVVTEFLKLHPPRFDGTEGSKGLQKFVEEIEKDFVVGNCSEESKMLLGPHQLVGKAHTWWLNEQEALGGKQITWTEFREKLYAKYLPRPVREGLHREFMQLKQGSKSVEDYESEFTRLEAYGKELVPTEAEKIRKFEDGLRFSIRDLVQPYKSTTYLESYEAALRVEANEKQKLGAAERQKRPYAHQDGKGKRAATLAAVGHQHQQHQQQQQQPRVYFAEGSCYKCGMTGHGIKSCKNQVRCKRCMKTGHKSTTCRSTEQVLAPQPLAALPAPAPPAVLGQIAATTHEEATGASGVITGTPE